MVVGSVNRDHVLNVDRRPAPGETVTGATLTLHAGGKGANQAVAAARLGGTVALVAMVGDDSAGTEMISALRDCGVDTSLVGIRSGMTTGAAFITVTPDGENAIVVAPGANHAVDGPLVEKAAEALRSAAVVLLQQEIPEEAVERAVTLSGPDTLVVLNAAPARPIPASILRQIDVLIVNEHEAAALLKDSASVTTTASGAYTLTEHVVGKADSLEAALDRMRLVARALLGLGPTASIVTLGPRGALVCKAQGSYHIAAPQVEVVDTTGAGDAFAGAMAQALAAGSSLRDAARRGVLAGALAVTRGGAQASFPSPEELEKLVAAQNVPGGS